MQAVAWVVMDLGPFDPDLFRFVIILIVVMIPIVAIAGAWTHRILKPGPSIKSGSQ